MNYTGVIIEESLVNNDILKKVNILSTKVEKVVDKHKTPWLSQWTLHTVEIPEHEAQAVAEALSALLDYSHGSAWYADFKNDTQHYVIFLNKVFLIDRKSQEQYDAARSYGISLGIPEYQVDFHPNIYE